MSTLDVIEAGFFIRTEGLGRTVEAEYEYRVWGRVLVLLAGANDAGQVWRQQGIIEGRLDWGLYDWILVESRSQRIEDGVFVADEWDEWEAPDESERPLTSRERRDAVALALHRTRAYIAEINTARL